MAAATAASGQARSPFDLQRVGEILILLLTRPSMRSTRLAILSKPSHSWTTEGAADALGYTLPKAFSVSAHPREVVGAAGRSASSVVAADDAHRNRIPRL